MTDRRTEELTDILMDAMYAKGYQNPKLFAEEIIKRLPPDWCGHSQRNTIRALAEQGEFILQQEEEIARLRKIEEAAVRISDKRTLDGDGYWVSKREMRYLDAALEEKP